MHPTGNFNQSCFFVDPFASQSLTLGPMTFEFTLGQIKFSHNEVFWECGVSLELFRIKVLESCILSNLKNLVLMSINFELFTTQHP
jgi:hypothetical protein